MNKPWQPPESMLVKEKLVFEAGMHLLYILFFLSLVFSLRAISSISIGLIIIAGLLFNKLHGQPVFRLYRGKWVVYTCAIFFLLHLVALTYTDNQEQGWDIVRIKSGLLFTPLAISCSLFPRISDFRLLFRGFCLVLLAACLYCLVIASIAFFQTGSSTAFFYHELTKPVGQHAIYFSIILFTILTILLEDLYKQRTTLFRQSQIWIVLFLSGFLLLLSSKLVISAYLIYLMYFFARQLKWRASKKFLIAVSSILIAAIILALTVRNPVKDRFYDIADGDLSIVKQDEFHPSNYFNGLQFRLLQWKFVPQVLSIESAWILGVSPGDAQQRMNEKYIMAGMYTGDPTRGDTGYLGYNAHNQFLETLMQLGCLGIISLLSICIALVRDLRRAGHPDLVFIILLLLAWLFTESVLETQYGILIFTFFPIWLESRGLRDMGTFKA